MHLSNQELARELARDPFPEQDAFTESVYRLYRLPPLSPPSLRAVVVDAAPDPTAVALRMDVEQASVLLSRLLSRHGRRVGDVVYNETPEPHDYVFYRRGDRFHVVAPRGSIRGVTRESLYLGVAPTLPAALAALRERHHRGTRPPR